MSGCSLASAINYVWISFSMEPMQLVLVYFICKVVSSWQSFKGGSVSGILEEEYENNNQTKVGEEILLIMDFEFSGHGGRIHRIGEDFEKATNRR